MVDRRNRRGECRFGRITGRVRDDYDTCYVTAYVGDVVDSGRDLRLVPDKSNSKGVS